ncbi:MAG: luciferase family protein [Pseudomonadota bacterium]
MTRLAHLAGPILAMWLLPAVALSQSIDLPERPGPRPMTTGSVPHVQINAQTNPELSQRVLQAVGAFNGIILEETRIGFPGSVAFVLDQTLPLANPEAIVVGREIAHMHPDGSLHAALDPQLAKDAVELGWAEAHPWANRRAGWEGFVMIFTPTDQLELDVAIALIEESYRYITGVSPK